MFGTSAIVNKCRDEFIKRLPPAEIDNHTTTTITTNITIIANMRMRSIYTTINYATKEEIVGRGNEKNTSLPKLN